MEEAQGPPLEQRVSLDAPTGAAPLWLESSMQVTVQIPDLIARGRSPADVAADVSRLAVLDAFRRGEISSGRAAQLVGMGRVSFLEFAGAHGVPTMNYDTEDFARELADIAARRT